MRLFIFFILMIYSPYGLRGRERKKKEPKLTQKFYFKKKEKEKKRRLPFFIFPFETLICF